MDVIELGPLHSYSVTIVTKHSTIELSSDNHASKWLYPSNIYSFDHLPYIVLRLSWQTPYTVKPMYVGKVDHKLETMSNHVQHVIKIFQALSLLTRGNNISRVQGESLV